MKIIIPFVVFLVCMTVVFAADYDVTVTPVKDSIHMNESAKFIFTIKNNLPNTQTFRLNTPEVEWSTNLPAEVIVLPNVQKEQEVLITPIPKYISSGLYGVKITVKRSGSDDIAEKLLTIGVRGLGEGEYSATIKTTIDTATKIDPREPITIRVNLENLNKLDFPELTLKVYGDLPEIAREQKISLGPLEKKVVEMTFDLNPVTQPKGYRLFFDLLQAGKVVEKADTKNIEIIAFTPEFEKSVEKSSTIFKIKNKITFLSDSNVRHTQTVKFPTNWFSRLLTSTTPDAYVLKEEGKKYLAWDIELGPRESTVVNVTVNYRIILYIIIIIAVCLILYQKYKSPIVIRKSIANVSTAEGGISELKVMLDISNRSKKEFRDMDVVDIIPNIAEVKKEFDEGTIEPGKIMKHRKKGTIMRWKIAEIAPGEERLISYHIKSRLSIIGNFRLPKAKMKFKDGRRIVITRSNTIGVSA